MKRLLLLLLVSVPGFSQPPDCSLPINIPTGATVPYNVPQGSPGAFDNRTAGCTTWQITYNSIGFSAVSIIVRTAPNSTGGVPGAYSTFTAVTGINPNTATTEAVSTFGGITSYFPWVSVQLTSATGSGTISGRLYGWRIPPTAGSSAGTTCPPGTPCVVDGPTAAGAVATFPPVMTAGWNGSTVQIPVICDQNTFVNLSGSGNTQIVALSGSKVTRVCRVLFSTTTAEDVKLVYGTGANCVTGPTDLSPLFKSVQSGVMPPVGSDFLAPTAPAGKAVCFNQSAAQANGVWVFYAQY